MVLNPAELLEGTGRVSRRHPAVALAQDVEKDRPALVDLLQVKVEPLVVLGLHAARARAMLLQPFAQGGEQHLDDMSPSLGVQGHGGSALESSQQFNLNTRPLTTVFPVAAVTPSLLESVSQSLFTEEEVWQSHAVRKKTTKSVRASVRHADAGWEAGLTDIGHFRLSPGAIGGDRTTVWPTTLARLGVVVMHSVQTHPSRNREVPSAQRSRPPKPQSAIWRVSLDKTT